ncbi:hypothetical protein GIB67_002144 [Kingdonia uniflora]|uniref:Uncharacterized protein n=1 Tax=Kingdonia uniflora TaxID=39325 RepID=A0A7J7KWJ8_9MAGN|nr:hypothetical protein GIB67_002144 [Kingdonia uniflora]
MEPYGYSLSIPSPDKGGGKRIKIHGIGYLEENNYCNTEQFSVSGKIPLVKLSLKRYYWSTTWGGLLSSMCFYP